MNKGEKGKETGEREKKSKKKDEVKSNEKLLQMSSNKGL